MSISTYGNKEKIQRFEKISACASIRSNTTISKLELMQAQAENFSNKFCIFLIKVGANFGSMKERLTLPFVFMSLKSICWMAELSILRMMIDVKRYPLLILVT